MFQPDKLTIKAQETLQAASQLAQEKKHQQLRPLHILQELLNPDHGVVVGLLQKMGVSPERLLALTKAKVDQLPTVSESAQVYSSRETQQLFELAWKEAERLDDEYLSSEHLLLAMLKMPEDPAGQLLKSMTLTVPAVEAALKEVRGSSRVTDQTPEAKYQALEKYGRNLTALAQQGKLDPVIGRDEEVRRCIQILSRRRKNNPVLIGDPGVGKTAIVEGLAQRIVKGDVPESLRGRTLFALDLGQLLAGAKYRGEFEERLQAVLKNIQQSNGKILCFIDELHTLVGAGAAEGATDAANLLKPALARGDLRCIGATTLDEYRKHIEKDAALERRFQPVLVGEPTVESTIAILRGLKDKYEVHHGVHITDQALVAAARLSNRYISDRFLPDKAIDLVDEAASSLRMEIDSLPTEIDQKERMILQLQVEHQALEKETDTISVERLKELNRELADLRESSDAMKSSWQREKAVILKIRELKKQVDQLGIEEQQAERAGDLAKLAEIRYGRAHQLKKAIEEENQRLAELQKDHRFLREEVTQEDIALVISRWTGIPVSKLLQGERAKLLVMEEALQRRVVSQDHAVAVVSEAVRRNRAGIGDPNRPIGTFLFLGPTGVGKTELAKALAALLFDDEKALVRLDMSEYMEKHSVSRMIGAPPGYIGHESGGQLTEAVRRRPYSIILLDEVEKAHPEVFNALLQLLDDGRMTDGQGRTVDFRQSIVIMTSNLGSQALAKRTSASDEMPAEVKRLLQQHFRPEFLNRIDEVVLFHGLSAEALEKIVDLQLERLQKRLSHQRISLEVSPAARHFLAEDGYDPDYGARPLKRTIQREVENRLAQAILQGTCNPGDRVLLDLVDGALKVKVETPVPEPSGVTAGVR